MAVWPTVLVLAWPQSDLTLGYGDLIWDGNTAMMVSVWAWQYKYNDTFIQMQQVDSNAMCFKISVFGGVQN